MQHIDDLVVRVRLLAKSSEGMASGIFMLDVTESELPVGSAGGVPLVAVSAGKLRKPSDASGDSPQAAAERDNWPAIARQMVSVPPGQYRYDHFLATLAREARFPLTADFFTRGPAIQSSSPRPQRVGDLVAKVAKKYDLAVQWQEKALLITSRDWAERADREPVVEVEDQVVQAVGSHQEPGLKTLLQWVQRSSDLQLVTLDEYRDAEGKHLPGFLMSRVRLNAAWLRGYAALSERERAQARTSAGLSLRRLERRKRLLWETALWRTILSPPTVGNADVRLYEPSQRRMAKPTTRPRFFLRSRVWSQPVPLWRQAIVPQD